MSAPPLRHQGAQPGPVGPPAAGRDRARRRTVAVQSVERAVRLLRAVATASGPGASVTALAASCGLNRATAWRLLVTLELQGLVVADEVTGRYAIGPGVAELAGRSRAAAVVRSARPALEQLAAATGETAAVAVDGPAGLTYVDEVAPPAIVAATWRGRTVPLHATSTGKVLLAFSGTEAAGRLTGPDLPAYTVSTLVDRDALLAELEVTRRCGFAVCRGEYEASAYGVSAPVLDAAGRPLAVLSVWGPADRVTEARLPTLGGLVAAAARDVPVG